MRDCTPDADRSILKDELHTHMMGIVKAETQKSNMKFSLEYFMMNETGNSALTFQVLLKLSKLTNIFSIKLTPYSISYKHEHRKTLPF